MKFKATIKDIKTGSPRIYNAGYDGMHHLLHGAGYDPIAYNAGVYGWNWDCYRVGTVAIISGYRSTPAEKGVKHIDGLQREYESKARAINEDYHRPREEREKEIQALLFEFLEKVKA